MPYIDPARRKALGEIALAESKSDLAFLCYKEAVGLLLKKGRTGKIGYDARIEIYGVLDGVAREFWDRWVRPYENDAMERNGDIMPCDWLGTDDDATGFKA